MLTSAKADADDRQGQPTASPPEAMPGARSAGDPTPVSGGGLGPTGLCQDTSWVLPALLKAYGWR
jgi:hypothetical protein